MEPGPLSEANPTGTWKDFLTLTKVGIVLNNLITTFTGIWIASVVTDFNLFANLHVLILAILGTAFVVAGGTSLNNFIDRDIDQLMARTNTRPSVTGKIPANQVLWVGLSLSALGTVLLYITEPMAALLGLLGLIIYVVLYTMWTKRTTSLNTVIGSFSGAMPPMIGWAAVDPNLHPIAWGMFLIMFLWQPPHFLALAMKRVDDYRDAGIPMLPVVAGFEMTKRQMVIYIAALIPVSLLLYSFGTVYIIAASVLGAGWLAIGIAGFFMKDDLKWARIMFVYSLNYLTILFILMIAVNVNP
ncbi:protoheme IX farnesyltransferase [Pseudalkalibacillus caeni]|uniref:Protoheme IX farnesyltransferase n=2 Tax=Exobacillus caeni TaxID=2574798 RepID=A0A5R9FAS1_9BACL|nr:protoheme IX farnesyltransferase [Pseudalkalibacillus caeni]